MKIWLGSIIVVILLGGGWFIFGQALRSAPETHYHTAPVARGDLMQRISVNGALNPLHVINVGTQVSGTIQKINVDFNQKVAKDQVLAEIDPALLQSQLDQSKAALDAARAKLELSQKTYARSKALLEKDYIARQDLDTALQDLENSRAQVVSAQAQVRRDQANVGFAVIRSPVSGVVISRDIDVGQTVAASYQTPELFKVAEDLKKMQINAVVSEADIGNVKSGMEVSFRVDAFLDRTFTGVISQIRLNSTSQQNVVTYNVLVDVDNKDETLLPGMTALVDIQLAKKANVLKVPNSALRFKPDEPVVGVKSLPKPMRYLYLLDGRQLKPLKVKTGVTDGRFTEIESPEVKEGDEVVTSVAIGE